MDAARQAELLQQEVALRREAEALLAETGLFAKLGKFGDVRLGGALSYKLTVARDIDVHIQATDDSPLDAYRGEILAVFSAIDTVKRLRMVDFDRWEPDSGKPKGIWFGVEFVTPIIWTLDLWITRRDIGLTQQRFELSADSKRRIATLPDETRALILDLKHYLRDGYTGFRPSTLVYLAVLEHGVRTSAELDAFIDTTRNNPLLSDAAGYAIRRQ